MAHMIPVTTALDTERGELVITVHPPGVPSYEFARLALPYPVTRLDNLRDQVAGAEVPHKDPGRGKRGEMNPAPHRADRED